MAFEIRHISKQWQDILSMQDEVQQTRAATHYVSELEREILRLKQEIEDTKAHDVDIILNKIMQSEPLSQWLKKHDDELYHIEHQNWDGFQS